MKQMISNSRALVLGTALIVCCQSGCVTLSSILGVKREPTLDTTMLKAQGYSIPTGGMPRPLPEGMKLDGTNVAVEIRGDETRMATVPLPAGHSVTIEDLYRKLELVDSLGASEISIMRPSPNGPPVRLSLMIDGKGKATNPGHNYALHPGDHIIASSDGRSMLERYMDRQFGRD